MEIGIVGSIRTPFGEVGLIPQDRNLLQASSVDPLQFGNLRIHLWAMLERIHEAWSISGLVEPVLLIEGSCQTSSCAGESIAAELMKPVTLLAGDWAIAHPEAFECAATEAFKFDKEGLPRVGSVERITYLLGSSYRIDHLRGALREQRTTPRIFTKDAEHGIRRTRHAEDHAGNFVS